MAEVVVWSGDTEMKCRIVSSKYVTVGDGRLKFHKADVVCVVRGY